MKVTRMITDNGMKIMHIQYSKKEVARVIANAKKKREQSNDTEKPQSDENGGGEQVETEK